MIENVVLEGVAQNAIEIGQRLFPLDLDDAPQAGTAPQ
jgi:hypothetical protein